MLRICDDCGRRYDDEGCSTICPHKGLGHCVVCDMVCSMCSCPEDTKHPRSYKFKENKEE